MAFAPLKFAREVQAEAARVTWPTRRETLTMTGLVLSMALVTAVFFFAVDQLFGFGIRALFSGAI